MEMYVLRVKCGYEEEVRDTLIKMKYRAAVPTEKMHIRHCGEWKICEKTVFSGYVFVECRLTDQIYYDIKKIGGIYSFLRDEVGRPQPLLPDEREYVRVLANGGKPIEASKIYTSPSGAKMIMSGILREYCDSVTWIDTRQRKAKLKLTLCGKKKEIVLPAVEI